MLAALTRVRFTFTVLLLLFTGINNPAQAFSLTDAFSHTSGFIDQYEWHSGNNPVIRGIAKIGDAVGTGASAVDGIIKDITRVNKGTSREKVLVGTLAKYGSQFMMQAGIGAAAVAAAPFCATTPITAFACASAVVSASIAADNLSDLVREGAEMVVDDIQNAFQEDESGKTLWRETENYSRQITGEVSRNEFLSGCEDHGASNAYRMIDLFKGEPPAESCAAPQIISDQRDLYSDVSECWIPEWNGRVSFRRHIEVLDREKYRVIWVYQTSDGTIESSSSYERCN